MTKIFAYKLIDNLSNKKWNSFMGVLSLDERKKIISFKQRLNAEISLVSRYLSRKIISLFVNVESNNLIFGANKYGRPLLKYPLVKNLDFNISHSGNWIVLAISKDNRVGIDIEKISPINISIFENYFTKQDFKYLNGRKDHLLENFYKIWTLKESFIKLNGKGLSYPLRNFYFEFNNGSKISMKIKNKKINRYFKMYHIDPGYQLSLCLAKNELPDNINIINI